jgi:pantothenate synthetase
LAKSSRNIYLSAAERASALAIPTALRAAHDRFVSAEPKTVGDLVAAVESPIQAAANSVDYVTAADPETLVPLPHTAPAPSRLFIAVAAFFGATRLIDNIVLGEDPPPR